MNYTILHLHSSDSNPKSGMVIDSITPFDAYIPEIVKNGMKAVAFTEHGVILHNVAKKQMCQKNGIKYIHAEEFYVTEKIDPENLVRDNYHCLLYAKNKDGVKELNRLSSLSFENDGHTYYNPRITLEELENTSDNIMVLTGCISGMLCKGNKEVKRRFMDFLIKNKHRCWLEVQPHNFDLQIQYNKWLYEFSKESGLRLIATNDIHAINEEQLIGRKVMQKSKMKPKKKSEEGQDDGDIEDNCDLRFKTYMEMVEDFRTQNALPESVFLEALAETNRFADLIEDYDLDYSNKYPRRPNAKEEFKKRIEDGIKERGIDKLENYETDYLPRIKDEYETFIHNDAVDFMLLDSDYKIWMKEHNMAYGPSRGSVSGSLIAYLIHSTDVDSVKYNLNFSRFMNPERVSLADVDTDIYADDRYAVREYFFNREDVRCCNILTFNTIKMRGAIKDVARALGYSVDEAQKISDQVYEDEKKKECVPDKVRKENLELFKYVDLVTNTIVSIGRHAAGIVVAPTSPSEDFGTLHIESDPRPVSQIDMHEIDSLNYVKMDLLGLAAVGLIDKACKLIGIPFRTPDNTDFNDENVIRSIAEDTTMIFQFESGFASDCLRRILSKETIEKIKRKNPNLSYLDLMSMCNGVIRPAGGSFRDKLLAGEYRDNGNEALNEFLKPTLGYLTYQEQIIDFLHEFCGFTMGQADIVRRGFAKKTGTEQYIPIIKDGGYMIDVHGNKDKRYIPGFIKIAQEKYGMTENEANEAIVYFLKVIEDASSYLFSKNHSDPYSMIGYFIGWLRYYYPLQLLTAALNVYKANDTKMQEIKNYSRSKGVIFKSAKFGKSRADYYMSIEENAIYQDLGSIKECNNQMAEELFELSENKYDSFLDLLIDIKDKTCVKKNQLDILIKINFFSDFGEIPNLLAIRNMFDDYYGKKQMTKESLYERGLDFDEIRQFFAKETPKMFTGFDSVGFIKSRIEKMPVVYPTLRQMVAYQTELLGAPDIIDKKYKGLSVVLDMDLKYSPRIKMYALANGSIVEVKIPKKEFEKHPLTKYDIVHVVTCQKKNKSKMIDGQWQKLDDLEWWVYSYEILADI